MAEAATQKKPETTTAAPEASKDAKNAKSEKASAAARPEAVAALPKKKDILGLWVFLLVTVNLIAVSGMGYFVKQMWGHLKSIQAELETVQAQVKEEEPLEPVDVMGKKLEAQPLGTLIPLDSFLVNIHSDQGTKFLQTQMELELADPGAEEEITKKKAAVRDSVIMLLSSRSYDELRQPHGIKKLRKDILTNVNNLLTTGKVREVFFTQFHFN